MVPALTTLCSEETLILRENIAKQTPETQISTKCYKYGRSNYSSTQSPPFIFKFRKIKKKWRWNNLYDLLDLFEVLVIN
jgi:hypothetical protein